MPTINFDAEIVIAFKVRMIKKIISDLLLATLTRFVTAIHILGCVSAQRELVVRPFAYVAY